MPEFFETRMGQQFYDGTMKRLAHAAESIATSLELQLQDRAAGVKAAVPLAKAEAFALLFGECVELLHGWADAWPEDGEEDEIEDLVLDDDDAAVARSERAELYAQTRALLGRLKGGGQ
jgi:hypothetical protein